MTFVCGRLACLGVLVTCLAPAVVVAAPDPAALQQQLQQAQAAGYDMTGLDATGLAGLSGPRAAKPVMLTAPPRQPAPTATRRDVSPDDERLPLPRKPSPFERQLSRLAGEPLSYYGYDLFTRRVADEGRDLPMADDYLLGPGDSVNVRIWGQLEADLSLTVDASGRLYLPQVGTVAVNGVRFSRLDGLIRQAVGRLYRNFDLAVASGDLKTLSITVSGFVAKPGVYPVSSQGTVFTALAAAGGPDINGSLRNIRVKRRNGQTVVLDLYVMLISGDPLADYRLQPGDVVFVPASGPRVGVAGGVVRPGIYETLPNVPLREALSMASGLAREADRSRFTLDRIKPGKGRLAQETTLDALATTAVRDGDLLVVPRVAARYDQSVSLRGYVSHKRQLAWREGLRVSDLIDSTDMLRPASFWERLATGDEPLDDADDAEGTGVNASALARQRLLGASGSSKPALRQDPLASQSQREDINWDYATIERLDPVTLGTELISFNLRRAVVDKTPDDDVVLQPGDVVTLYSTRDIAVPKDKRPRYVRITGEVAQPGVYRVKDDETLPQLVRRVGGLTRNAYLFGLQFTREEVRERQRQALKAFVERQEKALEQSAAAQASSALGVEDIQRVKAQIEAQRAALQKLKAALPSGRVVLGLDTDVNAPDDLPNMPLDNGDSITIPALPSTVNVQGEVFSPGDYLTQSSRVGAYLDLAGGDTDAGEIKEAFVLRADGSVVARKQKAWLFGLVNTFGLTRAMPGDTLIVPAKLERVPFLRSLRDISQVFSQFGLGAAAINNLTR